MSDKNKEGISAKAESNKAIKSMEEKDLHRLHGEASRDVTEILDAADAPKDNPDAHIDWDKAAAELDKPAGEVKELLATRMREVEDAQEELLGRATRRRADRAANSDVSHLESEYVFENGEAVARPRPASGYHAAVAGESELFKRQHAERKSYLPKHNGGAFVVEQFENALPSQIFAATNTTDTSSSKPGIPPNDDIDHGRSVVMYNDPMVAIGPRLSRVSTINGGDSYTYWKEGGAGGDGTAEGNTVASVAEATKFAEQEFVGKIVTVHALKLAAHSKVSDEVLSDVNVARDFFNRRFRRNFEQTMENQIVKGTGTTPQWSGLTVQSNRQTDAVTAKSANKNTKVYYDVFIDAWQSLVGKAYVMPSLVAMPSLTLATFAKKKDKDDNYIWASVSMGLPRSIFGIPVAVSEHLAANSAIMLDLAEFSVLEKQGVEVEWGFAGDDFISGIQSIRGTCRGNVIAWRENALIHMTGLQNVDA